MSYEAAIGQIDQILQWQQQIADPATAAQSPASSGADGASSTDSAAEAEFATALAEAQAQSVDGATGLDATDTGLDAGDTGLDDSLLGGGDSQLLSLLSSLDPSLTGTAASTGATSIAGDAAINGGTATIGSTTEASSPSDPRILAMITEANSLVGKPYVWGGGHDGWGSQAGYDCSGFVSAVLHAGGYLTSPQDTATLPSAGGIDQGPGQYVTIYDRDESGEEGHVIIEIDGQFYESGGEHGSWGGGGGVERISTPSAAYLSTFNDVLHPAGL